jgi:hypothetical protein
VEANKREADRKRDRLARGFCRQCSQDTPRAAPSDRFPDGDPSYCSRHRVMADANNAKSEVKR